MQKVTFKQPTPLTNTEMCKGLRKDVGVPFLLPLQLSTELHLLTSGDTIV